MRRVLVIGREPYCLPWRITRIAPGADVKDALSEIPDAVLVSDASTSEEDAMEWIRRIRSFSRTVPVIVVAYRSSEQFAIHALNAGACRYLKGPVVNTELAEVLEELVPHPAKSPPESLNGGCALAGNSPAIQELRTTVRQLAAVDCNVLILGETGTGKEVLAELIHRNSPRRNGPLIFFNSAAIPDTLAESELFGHERGAFTGAHAMQKGKLFEAHKGAAFLDEVGDLTPSIQAKLLRALERGTFYRLGGSTPVEVDIRVIAATNQDLLAAVGANRFRRDLYYRLKVIQLTLPPLRERLQDIPLLVDHFVASLNRRFARRIEGLSASGLAALCEHDWPGNVRELRNVIEAVFAYMSDQMDGLVDLPMAVIRTLTRIGDAPEGDRERLIRTLSAAKWNKSRAARELHWSRTTVYRKMKRYQLA